jgi:hypothetical protein
MSRTESTVVTVRRSRNQMIVLMLVVVLELERAGNCGTRQRMSISYGSIRLKYGAVSVRPRKARCLKIF